MAGVLTHGGAKTHGNATIDHELSTGCRCSTIQAGRTLGFEESFQRR